jgi:hypothetical protein
VVSCENILRFDSHNGLIAKDPSQRHLEARQQGRGVHVVLFARKLERPPESRTLGAVDAVDIGIHDPIFRYAGPFVETTLDNFVAPPRLRRTNLDDQIGRPPHVLVREDLNRPLVRHKEKVRLDDVEVREDDIKRRVEQPSNWMSLEPAADQQNEIE